MNYVAVESSNLSAVGYDEDNKTLGVRFRNGGEYENSGVPAIVYRALLAAQSVGKYYQAHVKDAGYRFCRIR